MLYGREYDFHSDFREWMRYELLMTDGDVDDSLRYGLAADIIFPPEQHIPLTRKTADFLRWFYHCGDPPKENAAADDDYFLESRLPYNLMRTSRISMRRLSNSTALTLLQLIICTGGRSGGCSAPCMTANLLR